MDHDQRTIATYDASADEYAERWYDFRLEADMACWTARLQPGARLLDVGCGPARDAAWLGELGFDPFGVDLSLGMLRQARRRNRVPVVQADMGRLPFAGGSFDGLWFCASLLHVPKAQAGAVLAELRRAVGDGLIYVAVKQGQGERWLSGSQGRPRFFAFYAADELGQLLAESGFRILEEWFSPDGGGRESGWLAVIARGVGEVSG